jgi:heme-degrading monooxygenase HmoA
MVFSSHLAVERVVLPEWDPADTFKEWQKEAAAALAKKIVEDNLMAHTSRYDIAGMYTHEAFTILVARTQRQLP